MLAINIRSVRLVSLITRNYCEGSFGVADDRDRRRTRREEQKREKTGVRKIAALDRETSDRTSRNRGDTRELRRSRKDLADMKVTARLTRRRVNLRLISRPDDPTERAPVAEQVSIASNSGITREQLSGFKFRIRVSNIESTAPSADLRFGWDPKVRKLDSAASAVEPIVGAADDALSRFLVFSSPSPSLSPASPAPHVLRDLFRGSECILERSEIILRE